MIIDCISDLHGFYPELEGGDLLIVGGDVTARDTERQHAEFAYWLEAQPYKKRIVIAGNHDNFFQKNKEWTPLLLPKAEYLCDSGTEFEYFDSRFPEEDEGFLPNGKRILKIWGSPWTLAFKGMNPHCKAFTVDTEEKLAAKWALIPDDIDILITHSPQYGMLDYIHNYNTGRVDHLGSKTLMKKTADLTNLQLHVYGHIHETYGTEKILFRLGPPAEYREICVNASHVNERYEPVNAPIRVIL